LKVLDRFFLGQFGPLRPLGIREKDVFSEERALKALSRLKSARQAIRDGASAREGLLKRLRRLTEEKNGLAAARALVKAGVSIAPREFGLKTPDLYSIEMERHAKSLSLHTVVRELEEFESHCRVRIGAVLGLLSFYRPGPRVHQPTILRREAWRLVRTLRIMESMITQFERLHASRPLLDALIQHGDS
ncbi:MAG: hypothetical protein GY859_17685, partial [Desulfobacterales bacterium]|nr:hypothetical protein [Desulfobacterales bacterium]